MGSRNGFDSRRSLRLVMPRTQLVLTGCVIAISSIFALFFAWHVYAAYSDMYAMLASAAPEFFLVQVSGRRIFDYQQQAFAIGRPRKGIDPLRQFGELPGIASAAVEQGSAP